MSLAWIRRAFADAPVVRAWRLAFADAPSSVRLAPVGSPPPRAPGTTQERSARVLFGVLLVYAGIALGTLAFVRVQRAVILGSHFRPVSIGAWLVLQPAPKMYGVANRVWTRTLPLVPSRTGLEQFERTSVWVNHYPARYARFDGERRRTNFPRWLVVRSRYRDTTIWTSVDASSEDGSLNLSAREFSR